jgi:GNAT superfamily N-acetyltransferase
VCSSDLWPAAGEWVIQHMIIDPGHRGQGIGSTIVGTVERYALGSEVDATSIFAIPVQKSGTGFWNDMGYTVETGRRPIKIADLDHELIIYRKEL